MKIYINNIFKKDKNIKSSINNMINKYNRSNENESDDNNLNDFLRLKEIDENIKRKTDDNNIEINYIRKGALPNKKKIKKLDSDKKNINLDIDESITNSKEKNLKERFKFNKYNLPKSYYALLVFMIFLAGLSIYMVKRSNDVLMEEDYAVFNSQDDNLNLDNNLDTEISSLQSANTSNIDTRNNFEESSTTSIASSTIDKIQEQVNNIVLKKEEPLVFSKPLDGEISKIFSNDKLIYSKTLEMWKTHDGIDVKGNIGDIVYSIERGTIEKIYDDAFYGITIVIDHGQGYKSSYSNLSEDTPVNVGDKIKKSQKIGKIGTTSIGEIKDVSHLHFMLYENENIADPSSIFK